MYTAKHIQFSEKHAEALPAYYRLQQTIMDKLVNGEWQAGKQLPSERQFAQTTGFSVGTVRKALENMVHQGYLVRIQGKGTYVTKSIIDKNAVKYYRLRRNLSEQDVSLSVELLSMEDVPRQAEMDRRFAVPEDIPSFLRIERLFSGEQGEERCPVALSTSYIPLPFGEPLKRAMSGELEDFSLYLLIEKYCRLPVLNSRELLEIEMIAERESEIMDLPVSAPVISSFMVSTSYDDTIVEFRKSLIRTEPFGLIRLHNFRE